MLLYMSNNISLDKQLLYVSITRKSKLDFYIVNTDTINHISIDEKFSNLDVIVIFNNLGTSINITTGRNTIHSSLYNPPLTGSNSIKLFPFTEIRLRYYSGKWSALM